MLESQWKTEKKMSVADVAHLECVPARPFYLLVAIMLDLKAALGHECLKLTRGETKPQKRKRHKKSSICKNVSKVSGPRAEVPEGHGEVQALRQKVCKGTERSDQPGEVQK